MKKFIRIAIYNLLGLVLLYILIDIFIWTTYSAHSFRKQIDKIAVEVKELPVIPERLTMAYEKIYAGAISNKITPDYFWINNAKSYMHYPQCFVAAQIQPGNRFHVFLLANAIEEKLSNEQCLAYMIHKFDFMLNAVGIQKAAKIYYSKTVDQLSEMECLELVAMMKNPIVYNKKKHPEKLLQRLVAFK